MKFRTCIAIAMAAILAFSVFGCAAPAKVPVEAPMETPAEAPVEAPVVNEPTDKEVAMNMDSLIAAIYVQERTDGTDAECAAAKAAWDSLTDAQKELVEEADYFGLDTGDAKLDDPLNADGIGENELLVVSFGTSFNTSRLEDIGGTEKAVQAAFPDWSVRRAFTAQIIINHVQARDGVKIDNMKQALDRAVANGVKNLVVLPTHLMKGYEYDDVVAELDEYKDKFSSIAVAEPLLGDVGADASALNADKETVAKAITAAAVADAGYASLEAAEADGAAFAYMGHGTSHAAKVTYDQMKTQMETLGYKNVFVGTVEGLPEGCDCESVIEAIHAAGYNKVFLRPLMVVAGDHANNDMAGDDADSWKSLFAASGYFDSIDCQIAGLGSLAEIQNIYVAHTAAKVASSALPDGVYSADFNTDSSMFRVNEANGGKGVLTVDGGKMTIHISVASKSILNLFSGSAEDAQKDGAKLICPTMDTVTYSDGATEEVHGFDIPVPALDEDFSVALVGTKGKWYDHTVSVTNPTPAS